ncbi:MAG: ABC transporter substrate-binding protein [Desulfatitalea sp.]|nr:ABC transporter substrate-binding protein [Desulfatitalea sp.]
MISSAFKRSTHRWLSDGMYRVMLFVCILMVSLGATLGIAKAGAASQAATPKKTIKAIYVPLADHYAAILAYEKYRNQMKKADFSIEQHKGWNLIRPRFLSDDVDMAFMVCPLAMEMFIEKPDFRWVSLMHRDGNALAVNDILSARIQLNQPLIQRKPDYKTAEAFKAAKESSGGPVICGVPYFLSTHTVILYKYLKDHGLTLGLGFDRTRDVLALEVAPSLSPSHIKKKNSRKIPAAFEQSLPWVDVVETQGFGRVAWYSKDVMPWPKGHIDSIAVAKDRCIKEKKEALGEVIYYIHKSGMDIEKARKKGGRDLIAISNMIRKHIPDHTQEAIFQSLRPDLNVINYYNLNVDKKGLKQIMDYAIEGGILRDPINIDAFADNDFSTEITKQ